jgi:hypothetical protein
MIGVLVAATLKRTERVSARVRVRKELSLSRKEESKHERYVRRDSSSSLCVTIKLGDDDGSEAGGLFERSRLSLGGLTDGGVEDHDRQVLQRMSYTVQGW